jgi:hypothetical protein
MARKLSLKLLISMILIPIGCAEDGKPIGYVVDTHGKWHGPRSAEIVPLTVLWLNDELRLSSPPGSIKMRFFPTLCETEIKCGGAEPCKNISIKQSYEMLDKKCHAEAKPWQTSLGDAWLAFFGPHAEGAALAITLSRGVMDDENPNLPVLQEAVLTVNDGRVDWTPLFRNSPAGMYSLQFCDPGSALDVACGDSAKDERITIRLTGRDLPPARFSKPEKLYRVRLWKMMRSDELPTERTAIVLVCRHCEQTQKDFEHIAGQARESIGTDRMIRSMLGAWLAEQAHKGTP